MGEPVMPYGKAKGTALSQTPLNDLKWCADSIAAKLEEGTVAPQYVAENQRLLAAMKAEMAARGASAGGPAAQRPRRPAGQAQGQQPQTRAASQPAAAAGTALARSEPQRLQALQGAFTTPQEIMATLREAAYETHLVTPQTSIGELRVGCSIATSLVWVDADTETYGIPHKNSSKRGLDKTALTKIANAAGVTWDPILCGRTDDGADPHYASYRAVGYIVNFDGTQRTEIGTVEMDLRDGSQTQEETQARADADGKSNTELAMMRKFILRHAESKAMNRVIRRLGLRTSYEKSELQKPFLVARLMFTGQTSDPEIRRMFAKMTFEAFHQGHRSLYANQQPLMHEPRHSAPPVMETRMQHAQTSEADQWDEDDGYYDEDPALGPGQPDLTGIGDLAAQAANQELKT